MKVLRPTILFLFVLLSFGLFAQPRSVGCHQTHNKVKPQQLTAAQLKSIENTIARSDTFDIVHYDISIDVTDYSNQLIKAATQIIFTPKMTGQNFITFDLFELQVDSVTHSSGSLAYSYDMEYLKIDLPSVVVGVNDTLTVHYQGDPYRDPSWGGFYFVSNYIYNLGIGLTSIPPNFGKVWYPCFDSFVERASYTYHVLSSGIFRAHCQGDLINEVQLGGDSIIRSFYLDQDIPTYCSAIAVSNYVDSNVVHNGAYGAIPMRFTGKPNQINDLVNKLVDLPGAIDALEHWYGPYDFDRVGYALTTQGALEISENIAYPASMMSASLFNNRGLYSHELGHMWWGNVVSPRVHNEMWLKEGPAEYAGHLVEEWLFGEEDFIDVVKDNQLFVLKQAHVQDNGFHPMSPMPDPEIYGTHTYYKGAATIHNIRGYLGDSLFRQAWSDAQDLLTDTAIIAEDLRDALTATSGVDMGPFFQAWVWQAGYSVFVVDEIVSSSNGSEYDVELNIRQRLREATNWHEEVPLDLSLIGANWERAEYLITASSEFSTVNVTCDFEPLYAVLNGHNRLNQARMDHEFVVRPGENFSSVIPYVDFRLYDDLVVDSTLIRIEHVWAGADQDQIGWGIDEMSETHYWTVGGLWSDLNSFHARIYYDGNASTDLDYDLLNTGEDQLLLVHRATPQDPWDLYSDFTLNLGSIGDGIGNIDIDVLRAGQYAFAKGNAVIGIDENELKGGLLLFPVPADGVLNIQEMAFSGDATAEIWAIDGKLQSRKSVVVNSNGGVQLNVSELHNGAYFVRMMNAEGQLIGRERFEIMR